MQKTEGSSVPNCASITTTVVEYNYKNRDPVIVTLTNISTNIHLKGILEKNK